jgi:hypothetical protein
MEHPSQVGMQTGGKGIGVKVRAQQRNGLGKTVAA